MQAAKQRWASDKVSKEKKGRKRIKADVTIRQKEREFVGGKDRRFGLKMF